MCVDCKLGVQDADACQWRIAHVCHYIGMCAGADVCVACKYLCHIHYMVIVKFFFIILYFGLC